MSFGNVSFFFENFPKIQHFPTFRKYFGIFDVFVKEIVIVYIGFGFVVLNSIWEHGVSRRRRRLS